VLIDHSIGFFFFSDFYDQLEKEGGSIRENEVILERARLEMETLRSSGRKVGCFLCISIYFFNIFNSFEDAFETFIQDFVLYRHNNVPFDSTLLTLVDG